MTSLSNGRSVEPLGNQTPRICHVPDYVSSAGVEAVELARMAGLVLDPWQEFVLSSSLGERADGSWASFEVGLVVSRQNGKGALLEARELAGLFLLGERLIIHSAHQFDTSLEHYMRMKALIENCPDLERRVDKFVNSHGEEGIKLKGGQRLRFRTRTKGGGRGFTGDCLILDEAMELPESSVGALLPTLSARPNPQVWYTGSAVDRMVHDNGIVLTRIRERGIKGDDALAYFEWSPDVDFNTATTEEYAANPENWREGNPGLGIRITLEHVSREQRSMDPRTFAVERLGMGDWPSLDVHRTAIISPEAWKACEDKSSAVDGAVCFAPEVAHDRSWASIAVAGIRADGLPHVEIVERHRGTGWVVERLAELCASHESRPVPIDGSGPAASLIPELEKVGVEVLPVTGKELGQACGAFYDAVTDRRLRHLGSSELKIAVGGAAKRPLGDAWAWSRKMATVDIAPLVAVTLALWGVEQGGGESSMYEDPDVKV